MTEDQRLRERIARLVAHMYANAGDVRVDHILATMILFEQWIMLGGDETSARMGWDVKPGEVVPFKTVDGGKQP